MLGPILQFLGRECSNASVGQQVEAILSSDPHSAPLHTTEDGSLHSTMDVAVAVARQLWFDPFLESLRYREIVARFLLVRLPALQLLVIGF